MHTLLARKRAASDAPLVICGPIPQKHIKIKHGNEGRKVCKCVLSKYQTILSVSSKTHPPTPPTQTPSTTPLATHLPSASTQTLSTTPSATHPLSATPVDISSRSTSPYAPHTKVCKHYKPTQYILNYALFLIC